VTSDAGPAFLVLGLVDVKGSLWAFLWLAHLKKMRSLADTIGTEPQEDATPIQPTNNNPRADSVPTAAPTPSTM
jgi:hypothetical protein